MGPICPKAGHGGRFGTSGGHLEDPADPETAVQNGPVQCAGILLTGGTSRRMGRDKATLMVDGVGLATRTGALLAAVCAPVVEVGPGRSGQPAVTEEPAGRGPLAGVAAGYRFLAASAAPAAALVVATDLPRLTAGLLRWLAEHPSERSVVPLLRGRPQPLCARYLGPDLVVAAELAGNGSPSMTAFVEAIGPLFVAEADWAGPAGGAGAIADVDTPADLARVTGR